MGIIIQPRSMHGFSGIICLPLKKNIQEPREGSWRLTECPACGEGCWESEAARKMRDKGVEAACTICALKTGQGMLEGQQGEA